MVKPALFSRSPRRDPAATPPPGHDGGPSTAPAPAAFVATGGPVGRPAPAAAPALAAALVEAAPAPSPTRGRWRARAWPALWLATLLLAAALGWRLTALPPAVTQGDIDAAVRESLEREPLPSAAAKAYEAVLPSVVRVTASSDEDDDKQGENDGQRALDRSLGSGVVIVDNGTILTSLHVVADARRLRVRFANGHESDAVVVGTQPENDLAVLRATSLPDDLEAATMRSTADLRPGDHVIAVGYPFGIGPSVSHGVVSGLKREFRAGDQRLTNLIQFDAAANPGNSGGPLVTTDGQVVGIVTAILNPSSQRTFIGIAFAVPIENAAAAAGMPPF